MSDIKDWSTTAGNNTDASPHGYPLSMAPGGVDNSSREVMAQNKGFWDEAFLRRVTPKTGAFTTAKSDAGTLFSCTGTWTATLEALVTVETDHHIAFVNAGTGVITIDGDGTETIFDSANTSITLQPGQGCILTYGTATNWAGLFLSSYAGGISNTLIQRVRTSVTAVATGTTVIPVDDTIPQNTEGDQYMSLAITPKTSGNIIRVEASFFISNSNAGFMAGAFFLNSVADAIYVSSYYQTTAAGTIGFNMVFDYVTASTSLHTFYLRCGGHAAGTTTFLGRVGGRLYGGVPAQMRLSEYTP